MSSQADASGHARGGRWRGGGGGKTGETGGRPGGRLGWRGEGRDEELPWSVREYAPLAGVWGGGLMCVEGEGRVSAAATSPRAPVITSKRDARPSTTHNAGRLQPLQQKGVLLTRVHCTRPKVIAPFALRIMSITGTIKLIKRECSNIHEIIRSKTHSSMSPSSCVYLVDLAKLWSICATEDWLWSICAGNCWPYATPCPYLLDDAGSPGITRRLALPPPNIDPGK